MPLGTREVLLIMSAQDRASGVFQTIGRNFNNLSKEGQAAAATQMQNGAALMAVGAGITAVGVSGLKVYADMGKAALEYNRQAVLTMTQTQGLGITLDQIKNEARDVAKEIPVPLEQLQGSLYDIFSSMDVNLAQSATLLKAFAKGAVAGQVEIQKSSEATIGLMNAFKVPIQDVNKVMDLQFQLVAKGVGTYDQFSGVLGLVSPSAMRAGQSMESMAGMMAFLTRNGLSTSSAAAASARALDSIANPKTVANFKSMGLTVADANGNFRPMVDIVQDMADKFKNLNPEQRSAALKELFQSSGGTIQAMRFWNTAVQNVPALKEYTQNMYDAGGAMDNAFQMFKEHDPGFQMQLLRNNMDVLKTEIGDKFLPILARLSTYGVSLLDWFDHLNPKVKNATLIIGLIVPVLITLFGIVIFGIGAFMAISAAAAFLGTSVGGLVGIFAGVVAAIIGLAAAGYAIYKNWTPLSKLVDSIADKFKNWRTVVNDVVKTVQDAWFAFLRGFENPVVMSHLGPGLGAFTTFFVTLGAVAGYAVQGIQLIWEGLGIFWEQRIMPVLTTLGVLFEATFSMIAAAIMAFWVLAQPIFDVISSYFSTIIIPVIQTLGTIIMAVFMAAATVIQWWWTNIVAPVFDFLWKIITGVIIPTFQLFWSIVSAVFQAVAAVVQVFWVIFSTIVKMIIGLLVAALKPEFEAFAAVAKVVFEAVAAVVRWAWENVIKPVWQGIVDWWNTNLYPVFKLIGSVWGDVWSGMATAAKLAFDAAKAVVVFGVNGIIDTINSLMSASVTGINGLVDAYNSVPGAPHVDKINAPHINRLHTGGLVTGAGLLGSDEVLRILQVGEGIVNKRGMSQIGTTGLTQLNSGGGGGSGLVVQEGAIQINISGTNGNDEIAAAVHEAVVNALEEVRQQLRAS